MSLTGRSYRIDLGGQIDGYESAAMLPHDDERTLLQEAAVACKTAYSPYSGFRVGAAALTCDGKIWTGQNVENASYGLTQCAERSALTRANAGGDGDKIVKLAVMGTGRDFDTESPVCPCGACRQVINEFEERSTIRLRKEMNDTSAAVKIVILMSGLRGDIWRAVGIRHLLPKPFGPLSLGIDITE